MSLESLFKDLTGGIAPGHQKKMKADFIKRKAEILTKEAKEAQEKTEPMAPNQTKYKVATKIPEIDRKPFDPTVS